MRDLNVSGGERSSASAVQDYLTSQLPYHKTPGEHTYPSADESGSDSDDFDAKPRGPFTSVGNRLRFHNQSSVWPNQSMIDCIIGS